MVEYSEMSAQLEKLGVDHYAPELHGLITGCVCSGYRGDGVGLLLQWLGEEPDSGTRDLLDRLFQDTGSMLVDPDLGFQPLVPDESHALAERGKAVTRWCMGFISGFGAAGNYEEDDLEAEVKEVLSDLHKISGMTEDIPDSEENEADLTEILEYVRVSVLLVFASCGLPIEEGDH